MEEVFSKEQLEELTKISKLPEEEQKKVLPNFLKKLSPEQLNSLKQSQPQQQQCPYCLIAENKIKSKKIYEDKEIIAVLEINPSNPGHTIVFPKQHLQVLSQLKDTGHLFNLVNKLSSILFDSLNAQGTNIFVANGQAAGQLIPHVVVNIIPRFNNDKLNLFLEHKKTSEEDLDNLLNKIKEKINIFGEAFLEKGSEKKERKVETVKSNNKRLP